MTIRLGILGYAQPEILAAMGELVAPLDPSPLVHVDSKVDLADYRARSGDRFTFLDERFSINWGGFRMVEASIGLIKAALDDPKMTRFVLLSDDSLPINPPSAIEDFYSDETKLYFGASGPNANVERVDKVFLPDCAVGALRGGGTTRRFLTAEAVPYIREAIAALEVKKSQPPFVYYKGSQWLSLSREQCELAVDAFHDEMYRTWFTYSSIPDEGFFQTVVMNDSRFAEMKRKPMILVDFSTHPKGPRVWSMAEFERLRRSKQPFARKFRALTPEILDLAREHAPT